MHERSSLRDSGRYIISITDADITDREIISVDTPHKAVTVRDDLLERTFLILIYRINFDLYYRWKSPRLVRFSKQEHSPYICSRIRLSTLAQYREDESLTSGQADTMEGRIKADATPFVRCRLSKKGVQGPIRNLKAEMTFETSSDPWVYCASICSDSRRDAIALARSISPDYDTITDILSAEEFAIQLGVDFAIALDPSSHIDTTPPWDQMVLARMPFDKIIHVQHGPITYEDNFGALRTADDLADLEHQWRACFTKPYSYSC